MTESNITMTAGTDWWLRRTNSSGRMRYPDRIRVGSADDPRVYVPERTCHVVRDGELSSTGVPRELRCSECGGRLSRFGSFCPTCGARVVAP